MKTSCIVSFGANALAIKDDASIAELNGDLQPFADLDALELGTVSAPYATFEPNYWLLDGNFKIAPSTNEKGGWVSLDMSGSGGNFDFGSPKPELQIDFDVVHSTDGLYFRFSNTGDYADSIRVVFYNASLVTIRDDTYAPSGETFFTNQPIANFKRILIAINSTNRASRYARILSIDFDTLTQFTGTEIKAARVVEQINPIAVELPINTLEFELFSSDGDFSIVEPSGFYESLQYKEPLDMYENVGGATLYIGRFYLDKWESKSANLATFEASDAIGLLDNVNFFIPNIFSTLYSEDIIGYIMDDAGIDYVLDASLEGIDMLGAYQGIFPVMPCREALQHVLFAIGGYATCSRSNIIQIKPLELAADLVAYDHTLTAAEKGIGSPISLKSLVTGIELLTHDYVNVADPTPQEIFSGTLAVGEHTIIYERPANTLEGGTLTRTVLIDASNYITINVTGAGTYTLEETNYFRDVTSSHTLLNGIIPAGTPVNMIIINDAIMVRPGNLGTIIQRVYDYYQQRYLQKTKLFASIVAPGDSVLVDVQSSKQLAGIVERMETDLAGGYVSQVEIVGVILP